ncbi:hypothetical protein CLF_101653 [Clonorchis sinensis]|uniref:Endonuclease/exonuclease/phosphatase domain-containing protein n=1 Tax=Clonorchis sinensis TaxID=79923 RepID=G7Y686_CLOSI|nr:hypothetical protein CLF_101653 [Clonorchis sinensis]
MNCTHTNKLMLRRPSRGVINRIALLAAYSKADKRKHATAEASLLSLSQTLSSPSPHPIHDSPLVGPALRTDDSVRFASVLRAASARHMASTSSDTSKSIFKPRHSVYLAAFNVRTLKQAGQQAALALTLESLGIYVCCVSETRIQDASIVIELTAPSVSIRFRLRSSGDPEAAEAGCAGVGIVLGQREKVSLFDWVPVDSHLCAVRVVTSVKESDKRQVDRCLLVVSAYAPTDCSSDAVKGRFYDALNALLQRVESSDIVVVAGDLNAQVDRLSVSETQLEGRRGLDTVRTDNGERLFQLCADRRLFLCNTNIRNSHTVSSNGTPAKNSN